MSVGDKPAYSVMNPNITHISDILKKKKQAICLPSFRISSIVYFKVLIFGFST